MPNNDPLTQLTDQISRILETLIVEHEFVPPIHMVSQAGNNSRLIGDYFWSNNGSLDFRSVHEEFYDPGFRLPITIRFYDSNSPSVFPLEIEK
jgi:hypothetical protein